MNVIALSLALCAALAAPRPPAPPPPEAPPPAGPEELEARLEAGLGRIHGQASPAFWRSLGPGAEEALLRIASDEAALPARRARALTGLSHVGGPRAAAALSELAGREGLPFSVRAAAMEGAGRVLSPTELNRALLPALSARRAAERTVAAEVLAERAPAEACGAIRVSAAGRGARGPLERAIARCAAAGR